MIDFVSRRRAACAAIAALVLFAVIRSAIATRTDGFTIDEGFHITAGVSYVTRDDFRINPEHPPLVKLWVGRALAPLFKLPAFRPLSDKAAERNFTESAVYLDNDPDAVQARARVAMLALNALLLLFLAFAVWRTMGPVVAVAATAVLAIDPTVAAHMPVVMTDLPVALLAAAAVLFAVAAFRDGQWVDIVLAALALGLTLGSKHSGIIAIFAVGAIAIGALAMPRLFGTASSRRRSAIALLVIASGSLAVLWALYGFRYSETPGGEEAFNRPLTLKIEDVRSHVARSVLTAMATMHLTPRAYIWGLADTTRAGMEGRGIRVYFFGRTYRDRGPFYYFPAVIAAKVPIGILALALAGVALVMMRRTPQVWRLPLAALTLLAILFLAALIRGVSYGGIRHALTIVVVVALFASVAATLAFTASSNRLKFAAAAALIVAIVSAVPRIRPWEYFNEFVGGPDGGYMRLGDEGVDVGQRDLDYFRYYRMNLQPRGEVPYLFYPIAAPEQERRGLRARGARGSEIEAASGDVTGTFFVRASTIFKNPNNDVFRRAHPFARIGNLLIYKGTFHLPRLRQQKLSARAGRMLNSQHPDLPAIEALLRESLALDPRSFIPLFQSGNLMLKERRRPEALAFYRRAREVLEEDEPVMREALTRQIARLESSEPLEGIAPVRGTRVE
jgi:4-amino-4-deoxy-L-arabinose transferase-like glycosyltransferase